MNEAIKSRHIWTHGDEIKIKETAARFYNIMDPWERFETTPEETAEEIKKNPLDAINYILDRIENETPSDETADDELLKDLTDDNELYEDVPGEKEFDVLTAVDFNLEDTKEMPRVEGEKHE